MYLIIYNKQYGIDSIEFTGNVLEAFVYDMDAKPREESIAIPFITKQQIDQWLIKQGREPEEAEDFVAWDYFNLFQTEIRTAIEKNFESMRKQAKITAYVLLFLFVAAHITTAVCLWLTPWYAPAFVYLGLMCLVFNFARKNHLI